MGIEDQLHSSDDAARLELLRDLERTVAEIAPDRLVLLAAVRELLSEAGATSNALPGTDD